MASKRLVANTVRMGATALGALVFLLVGPAAATAQVDGDPGELIAPELPGLEAEGAGPTSMTAAELARLGGEDVPMVDAVDGLVEMSIRRFFSDGEIVMVLAAIGPSVDQGLGDGFSAGFLQGTISDSGGVASFDSERHLLRIDLGGQDDGLSGAYAVSYDSAVLIVAFGMSDERLLEVADAQLAHRPSDRSIADPTKTVSRSGSEGAARTHGSGAYQVGRVIGALVVFGIIGLAITGVILLITKRRRPAQPPWPHYGPYPPPGSHQPPLPPGIYPAPGPPSGARLPDRSQPATSAIPPPVPSGFPPIPVSSTNEPTATEPAPSAVPGSIPQSPRRRAEPLRARPRSEQR